MVATLPTDFLPNHAPTAAEMGQVLTALSGITNAQVFAGRAGGPSLTASLTYIDVGGYLVSSFQKQSATSAIFVFMAVGWRVSTTPNSVQFGVHINGADYDVTHLECTNAANSHMANTGFASITGIPAGTWAIQGRIKSSSGGTFTCDNNDLLCMVAWEIPG